jgi:putative ABC transport system permease protein
MAPRARGGLPLGLALENLRIALQSLLASPLRSCLTLVGIAVGIAAVLHVVTLGRITQQRVARQLESMGSNVLLIRPGYANMRGVRGTEVVTSLTWDDARQLEGEAEALSVAVPTYAGPGNAEYGGRNWRTRVTGTTPEYFPINNESFTRGRGFDDEEVAQRQRVAVIGDTVRRELFGPEDALGARIRVESQRFKVIGVLAAKGESWTSPDDQIFVPLTTAQERLFGVDYLSSILTQTLGPTAFDQALFEIESILRRNHRLREDQDNDFQVRSQDFFLATIQDTNREIANFVILIALISLLIGGLGIANVMLVSVTERTREVGIRRAVGATRGHVLGQFLTEAALLGLAGGLFGVIGGTAFNQIQLGEQAVAPLDWTLYSFAICAGIGVIAGVYPAVRAAYQNVLDALRHE